jgi:Flp pilus assembly protein TadD
MLKRQPKSVPALTMLGMVLEMQGKSADAEKQYEKALDLDPHAVVAANNLAWSYANKGANLDVALQLAQAAKRYAPDQPVVNDTLGWVYYKKNLFSLAVVPLELSVANAPKNPVFRYHLGLVYAKLGYSDRARKALTEAIKLSPQFEGVGDARTVLASLAP